MQTNYKGDISAMAAGVEVVTVGAVAHIVLYQAWWRQCSTGEITTYQVLEGPLPGRADDHLIEFNYDDSDNSTSIALLGWSGTEWLPSTDPVVFQAAVGINDLVPDEWLQTGGNDGTGTFAEMAVDLTASGLFTPDVCDSYIATAVITETGEGADPALIDWAAFPVDKQVAVHNCGTLVVEKAALPASASSADIFEYSVARSGGGPVHESAPTPPVGVTDTDASETGITGAIGVGDRHEWVDVFAGDDYTIQEAAIAANLPWLFDSLTCSVTPPGDVEPVEYPIAGPLDEFPIYVGVLTECVITNTTSYLTVTKLVNGAEDQSFGFDVSPAGTTPDTTPELSLIGSVAGTISSPLQFKPGTVVTVTELLALVNSGNGTEPDWSLTDISGGTPSLPAGNTVITTVAGETVNVGFENTQSGVIIVHKLVDGAAVEETFTFTGDWTSGTPAIVGGQFDITATEITDNVIAGSRTFTSVVPGEYTLTEELLPGFDTTYLTCVVDGVSTPFADLSAEFTLTPGGLVECTFTNTERGIIYVDKDSVPAEFDLDVDFTFTPEDSIPVEFQLNDATDDEANPWSTGLIAPGTYKVAETVPADWSLISITGGGTVDLETGETVLEVTAGLISRLVFTNTAHPGGVTLTKLATGAEPGLEWSFEFILERLPDGAPVSREVTATTPTVSWGDLEVGAAYSLTETAPPTGWTTGPITCEGPADLDPSMDGFQFLVTPGLEIDCVASNVAPEEAAEDLPETGINLSAAVWLGVAALLLGVAFLIASRRRVLTRRS